MSNKLTIFGSALRCGPYNLCVDKMPLAVSSSGLATSLEKVGNKVKHYGIRYPVEKRHTLRTIGAFTADLARKCYQERSMNRRILNIGGSPIVSVGSVCGTLHHNPETILIWMDDKLKRFANYTDANDINEVTVGFIRGDHDKKVLSTSKYIKSSIEYFSLIDIDYYPKDSGVWEIVYDLLRSRDPTHTRPIYVCLNLRSEYMANHSNTLEIAEFLGKTKRVIGLDLLNLPPSKSGIESYRKLAEAVFNSKT